MDTTRTAAVAPTARASHERPIHDTEATALAVEEEETEETEKPREVDGESFEGDEKTAKMAVGEEVETGDAEAGEDSNVKPDMLEYAGFFRLPAGKQAHNPALPEPLRQFAKFGWGGRALGSSNAYGLLISGHAVGDLVAEVRIPPIGEVADLWKPFCELVPAAELRVNRLDELVGVAEHRWKVVGLYQRYYQVDGKDGGRKSFFDGERLVQLGSGELKKSSGYLTSFDGSLWCGRSDGAGNAQIHKGPVLYRINPDYTLEHFPIPERPDWSPADKYTGLVFLPGHVCWLVSKDVNLEPWYGTGSEVDQEHRNPPAWFTPSYAVRYGVDPYAETWKDEAEWRAAWEKIGIRDLWSDSKGYHCERRGVWLLAYKWPIVPGDEGEILKLDGFHASSDCGGLAFDGLTGRLYVFEGYPPDEATERGVYPKESPRIHVYNLGADGAGEPEPERPSEIVVTFPEDERPVTYANTPKGRLELIHDVSENLVIRDVSEVLKQ